MSWWKRQQELKELPLWMAELSCTSLYCTGVTKCDKLWRHKNETCVTGSVRKYIAKDALNFDGSIYTLYMCKSAKLYWW